MSMLKAVYGALIAGAALAPSAAHAQGIPPVLVVDLTSLDCRQLLQMEGEGRNNAILFLHGYVSGKTGQTKIEVPSLSDATGRIINQCIDKPSENVLAVFTRNRK